MACPRCFLLVFLLLPVIHAWQLCFNSTETPLSSLHEEISSGTSIVSMTSGFHRITASQRARLQDAAPADGGASCASLNEDDFIRFRVQFKNGLICMCIDDPPIQPSSSWIRDSTTRIVGGLVSLASRIQICLTGILDSHFTLDQSGERTVTLSAFLGSALALVTTGLSALSFTFTGEPQEWQSDQMYSGSAPTAWTLDELSRMTVSAEVDPATETLLVFCHGTEGHQVKLFVVPEANDLVKARSPLAASRAAALANTLPPHSASAFVRSLPALLGASSLAEMTPTLVSDEHLAKTLINATISVTTCQGLGCISCLDAAQVCGWCPQQQRCVPRTDTSQCVQFAVDCTAHVTDWVFFCFPLAMFLLGVSLFLAQFPKIVRQAERNRSPGQPPSVVAPPLPPPQTSSSYGTTDPISPAATTTVAPPQVPPTAPAEQDAAREVARAAAANLVENLMRGVEEESRRSREGLQHASGIQSSSGAAEAAAGAPKVIDIDPTFLLLGDLADPVAALGPAPPSLTS
ncbi:hypothetical protein PAPYR_7942 [Paratrimastix pyriformis]|uniref:PSI domain-containing protein n=1 Tax=Paratrimastix pyriformis TaxID=342808 RepID=A0ABQ8UBS2_9EUKA|nr:hypothetical protein PAPYR_7942 [Paratrimastix pyriformis]